jgi:adenosylhomocysteine nucleosidase
LARGTEPAALLCVCGLAAEARIARAAGFMVVVGAGNRGRTTALVEKEVHRADCIVSFGIAGALAPELRAGDVVVSAEVVSGDQSWRTEEPFCRRITAFALDINARQGPVLGSAAILATAAEKRRAQIETGALAVDLESDVVARIAASVGIPFVVMRAIADTADRELPPAALIPLGENGTPKLDRVLASVLRRPHQVAALIGLARDTRTALSALAGPARALRQCVAG